MQKISLREIAQVRYDEGFEVGLARGEARAIARGEFNRAVKTAIKMIKANYTTSEIIKYTELPLSKVLELQSQHALQTV